MGCHRLMCHHHHIICEHQIEIEVWPACAEVYFQDEAHCNPANTQVRFDAIVYNAPSSAVLWKVCNLDGGPGKGTIDKSGLYTAPPKDGKDGLLNGDTEIIVAAAADDPFRQARAFVTLIGRGPEPPPSPSIMVLPKRVNLYYRTGENNDYIDESNTRQVFRALVANSESSIDWQVNHTTVVSADPSYLFCYIPAANSGSDAVVTITAMLSSQNAVKDEARVVLVNYKWPGIE